MPFVDPTTMMPSILSALKRGDSTAESLRGRQQKAAFSRALAILEHENKIHYHRLSKQWRLGPRPQLTPA